MKWDIGAVFGQIVTLYAKLPLAQKIAIPFLIATSMGVIVFVSRWANQADYAVLYSGLEDSDAASVVEKLKEQKIGFRLRDDGRTIDVTPPSLVHELRIEYAAKGLPRGGSVGYELFNETTLGRTGFVEKITKQRALQGELERTIGAITAVKSVRVHITQPEKSMFVTRDVAPTASVLLRLKPGEQLNPQQISGIANLVAHSVERLTPENVSILDSTGAILNEQKDIESSGLDSVKLDYRRRLEMEYSRRIETMLAEVLGPGKAVARVTADIDFSKYEKEEESYDPSGQVVRSMKTSEEGAGLEAQGGVPGIVSNLSNDQGLLTAPDSAKNNSKRRESVSNYEVSRAISKTVSAVGTIKRLTVAVLVDGQYTPLPLPADAAPGTEAPKSYAPLPTEMMKKIDNLVKQSVGFENSRGDTVTVENIRFYEPDASIAEAMAKAESTDQMFRWAEWALPIMFTLLFFFVIVRPLVRFLTNPTEAEVDLSRLLPAGIEELEAELDAERSRLSTSVEVVGPSIDIEELEQLLSENSKLVKDSPQQAALLIRYWLNDGRI